MQYYRDVHQAYREILNAALIRPSVCDMHIKLTKFYL